MTFKTCQGVEKGQSATVVSASNMEVGRGVAPACNPVILEVEAEGSLQV